MYGGGRWLMWFLGLESNNKEGLIKRYNFFKNLRGDAGTIYM
jgi:hypothetical protein